MKVVVIGREDHKEHINIRKFLELGPTRGHEVTFCNDSEVLEFDFSDVDIVILKTQYYNEDVWEYLNNYPQVQVINSYKSTKMVMNRNIVDQTLEEIGIPIPRTAKNEKELAQLDFPIFVKSLDGNDHEMRVYNSLESIPKIDFSHNFYQEMIPNDGLDYKCYGIGDEFFGIVRKASQAKSHFEKVHEKREEFEITPGLKDTFQKVRNHTKLDFFGLDLLKHSETGKFYAIDINLFPGFIGLPKAPLKWWEYIENLNQK